MPSVHQTLEPSVNVYPRADNATKGDGDNEKHGILALRQILDGRVQAYGQTGKSEAVVERRLVFLADSAMEQCACNGSCDDGRCIDNGSYHVKKFCVAKIALICEVERIDELKNLKCNRFFLVKHLLAYRIICNFARNF